MDVLMPQLGETVAEGKIVKWFKAEGDQVAAGENLCEIETDKVTIEVPALVAGVLSRIAVGEGSVAPVGTVIAVIAGADETAAPAPAATAPAAPAPAATAPAAPAAAAPAPRRELDLFHEVATPLGQFGPARTAGGALSTPLARRLAGEAGIDIAAVAGSGPHGRITGRDVEAAIRARPAAPPALDRAETFSEMIGDGPAGRPHAVVPVDGMRRTLAARLAESKSTVPHFYLVAHLAVDPLLRLREEINADARKDGEGNPAYRVSVNDMIVKAWALALKATPKANAIWAKDGILQFEAVDVAVAVAVANGILTPVINGAEAKSLSAISGELKALSARARDGRLRPDEYKGGSTSISNLGMYGVVAFSAIINPPQSSILAVGAPERVAVEGPDGSVRFASRITATLSCDHRVIDGVLGAQALEAFKANIEAPLSMLV